VVTRDNGQERSGLNQVSARASAAMIRCGHRLATSLGPAAASPLPLLPGLRPTQAVCEPVPQLLLGGSATSRFQRSETIGNDNEETLGSIRGLHRWTASSGAADPRAPG
jgi:hypothetical protein